MADSSQIVHNLGLGSDHSCSWVSQQWVYNQPFFVNQRITYGLPLLSYRVEVQTTPHSWTMIPIVTVSLKLQFKNINGIHKVSSIQRWDFQKTAFWTRKHVKCLHFKNFFFVYLELSLQNYNYETGSKCWLVAAPHRIFIWREYIKIVFSLLSL